MALSLKGAVAPRSISRWDPEVGERVAGVITYVVEQAPRPGYDQSKLEIEVRIDLVDSNGEPVTVWALKNNDVEGDGYPSRLFRAIYDALEEANCDMLLEEGGRLAIQRIEDIPPTQRGRKPAKAYSAAYRPPAATQLKVVPDRAIEAPDGPVYAEPTTARPRPTAAELLGD
jgi:hypothetical protein